jgi:glycine oxidase
VSILGAGIAGTWQALLFAKAGYRVTVYERSGPDLAQSTSVRAGGMLAPWCEQEAAEPIVTRLGSHALPLWRQHMPDATFNGSLVIAHERDRADFDRFARLTNNYERLDADAIARLEPMLAGRFREALFFRDEGHVEPRHVLSKLHTMLAEAGGSIQFDTPCEPSDFSPQSDIVIDCRGVAARESDAATACADLRGVKGEMIVIETPEVQFSRPIRFIHPRWALYIIPRDNNRFMLGATTIESEDVGVGVRSVLELLSAAYAVHPAFGEARIVELGAGLRPAFPDNLPRININGGKISVNGLYRHGFLLAPTLAQMTLAYVARGIIDNEVMRCN